LFMEIRHPKGSYNVVVERGGLSRLPEYWPLDDYSSIAVITTEALWNRFGPLPGHPVFIPDGEQAKTLEIAESTWEVLYSLGLDHHSLIIALGGGSVGDLAGFTAATFMRGIDVIQLPTTLVAMLDAAIGGKTAINFAGVKNGIGAMHHPRLVLIDPTCLTSLPQQQLASGMAEAIKSAIIGDPVFFDLLEQAPYSDLETVIRRSAAVKANVVNGGVRHHLNYGHTFGHAIEALSGYTMVHGEAVAIGMQCAGRLSVLLGKANESLVQRQKSVCKSAGLPTLVPDYPPEDIVAAMKHDKKRFGHRLRLVVAEEIGRVTIVEDIPDGLLVEAIEG
jgi:3-dehydroquinate synthase